MLICLPAFIHPIYYIYLLKVDWNATNITSIRQGFQKKTQNSKLKFFIIGGVRSNFRSDSPILF